MAMNELNENEYISFDAAIVALSNPLILQEIVKYGTVKDLKCFRLVSKWWYDSARKPWRKLSPVTLNPTHSKYVSEFLAFLDSMDSPNASKIYGNFILSLDFPRITPNLFQSFVDTCGPHLTVLDLYGCTFPNVGTLRKALFKSFPNMTQLSYICGTVSDTSDRITAEQGTWKDPEFGEQLNLRKLSFDQTINQSGITWIELLGHYPNLKELNIRISAHRTLIDQLFATVATIRQRYPSKLQLTTITTNDTKWDAPELSSVRAQVLLNSGLQLESLALGVSGNIGAALLKSVITKHGKFLRKLELCRLDSNHLDPNECFPVDCLLENLQELKLTSRIFTTLAFLKYMPNLKMLSIGKLSATEPSLILESAKLPEMRQLKLLRLVELEMENFVTVKRLQLLMAWLPNVERLKIPLDNLSFEQVCKGWTNLTKLDISTCDVDEGGLTGLDAAQVEMVNKGLEQRPPTVHKANIGCLKYLKSLSIGPPRALVGRPWGRCSAIYGFQQLPNFKDLVIKIDSNYHLARQMWP